jgi:hypothetical protein
MTELSTQHSEHSTNSGRRVMEIFLKYARFFGLPVVECIKTEYSTQDTGDRIKKAEVRKTMPFMIFDLR